MEQAVTSSFLEYGVLGLVVVACGVIIAVLWKKLDAKEKAHSEQIKTINESHANELKERDRKYDEYLKNMQQGQAESYKQFAELTREVTQSNERMTAVVDKNTEAINVFRSRFNEMFDKINAVSVRVERLEGK